VKRVFGSFNQQIVHHAKNLLEAAGIRVVIRNEHLSSAMGELPPAECQAELWVDNEAEAARAEEILRTPSAPGADWTCSCGEMLGAQFTQCWRCGVYRRA
jgi:hypothetical protein